MAACSPQLAGRDGVSGRHVPHGPRGQVAVNGGSAAEGPAVSAAGGSGQRGPLAPPPLAFRGLSEGP